MTTWVINRLRGDKAIWFVVFLITLLSILAVYSASGSPLLRSKASTEYWLLRHVAMLGLGLVVMYVVHHFDYRVFARLSNILLYITVPLLAYTLIFGVEKNDANRWINFLGQSFQPSDLAKVAIIVFLARVLTEKQNVIEDFRETFLPVIAWVIGICMLIAPANLSTALLVFTTSLMLMFIAGVHIKYIGGLILIGLLGIFILFNTVERASVWKARLEDYYRSLFDAEYVPHDQVIEANAAIASAGWLGKGAGKGTEKYWLANSTSDMVYPVIIEEFGPIFGGLLTLGLYLMLLIRGVGIVTVSKTFGALLAAGLSFLLVVQAMVNMGVAVGLLPVTGLQLPMLSMGGTSMVFTGLALGIILSVSRHALEPNNGGEAAVA